MNMKKMTLILRVLKGALWALLFRKDTKCVHKRFETFNVWFVSLFVIFLQVSFLYFLGKAFNYTLNQWPRLIKFLDNGLVRMDNNLVENAIRPFVIGRKNWLFSVTPEGARASATFYSLIETAKVNGLEPAKYLRYLFEKFPYAKTSEDVFNLLPMNISEIDLKK